MYRTPLRKALLICVPNLATITRMKLSCLLIAFLLLLPVSAFCKFITGKVVGISDGDTITIIDDGKNRYKIRLYGVDCPESGQAFGNAAKKHTAALTAQKMATVEVFDTDRYGRTVGVVTVDGANVNQSLIEAGYAWQYRQYCKETFCSDWLQDEELARKALVGMWSDPEPVPPWEWRRGAKSKTSENNDVSGGALHGNVKSHVFHQPSCRDYSCKNCVEMFQSREAALATGYRPCGRCNP